MTLPNVYGYYESRQVVNELCDHILKWGRLSLVDMYEFMKRDNPMVELPSHTYKDNTIGWDSYDIQYIVITDRIGGSVIRFPEPHILDMGV